MSKLRLRCKHKPTWKLSRKRKPRCCIRTNLPTAPAAYISIQQRRTSPWRSRLSIPTLTGNLSRRHRWAREHRSVRLPRVQPRVKRKRSTRLRRGRTSPGARRASSTRGLFSPRSLCSWNEGLVAAYAALVHSFPVSSQLAFTFWCWIPHCFV
jgi:hypothetical protein